MSSWHFNKHSAKHSEILINTSYHLIFFYNPSHTQLNFLFFDFDKIAKRISDFNSFQISDCSFGINSISSYDGEIPPQTINGKSLLRGSVCWWRVWYASNASAGLLVDHSAFLLVNISEKDLFIGQRKYCLYLVFSKISTAAAEETGWNFGII